MIRKGGPRGAASLASLASRDDLDDFGASESAQRPTAAQRSFFSWARRSVAELSSELLVWLEFFGVGAAETPSEDDRAKLRLSATCVNFEPTAVKKILMIARNCSSERSAAILAR